MFPLLVAVTLLQGLSSCYDYGREELAVSPPSSGMVNFIKLTVSVRGSASVTRGVPAGGEDGDGREKGIDTRENLVEGLTLVFFRNEAGINADDASAEATPIDFVAYYATERDDSYSPRPGATHYPDEVYYSTGEQVLDQALDATQDYHMLVVANADLTGAITTSQSLREVRDMVYVSALYQGTVAGATKFVMTSADDNVLTFDDYTENQATNRRIFQFDNIHIERMAARIDYWAMGASYTTEYDHDGYLYNVDGSTTDKFVLTSIEPFNLNVGAEYLFKRTGDATSPYLASETLTNWVVGPYSQVAAEHPSYMASTLTAVATRTGGLAIALADRQADKVSVEGEDDIILAYPKENTIGATTPIYYYATGLAFEGYYYESGAKTNGERRVYYHFLRHQGEQSVAYSALTAEGLADFDKTTAIGDGGTPMNFGVVRNNIYRVSIEGINSESSTIRVKIEEKPWRYVENPAIYL